MLSLYKIWTVSRYETKTLLRSWFFRIFSILAIAILIMMSIGIHTKVGHTPWFLKGMDASLPYMYIQLLNIVQAIIGVFLASDFLKRDKKLDTTEVVYMRSMTNGDYVMGKSLGILMVFMALNIIVLLVAAVFHIFFAEVSFSIIPYLVYPLFISFPTLVFIFGLAFLFMVLIRNQAVTFIVLLGYIALTLFFLADKIHYIFDYMTFNVPLMYSDFIGFGNLGEVLIHRGIYFLLGLGFIFATILMIKRLPQSNAMTRFSMFAFILCLSAAIVLTGVYLNKFSTGNELRSEMIELNKKFASTKKITPLEWKLNVNHKDKEIDVKANLSFTNNHKQPLNKYIFSLNPGMEVLSITSNQQQLEFDREHHIISITPSKPLVASTTDSLFIQYKGTINEQACYLDIDNEERTKLYRVWIYNIAKRFAIIEPNYVLLTPETNWYPIVGIPYGAVYPDEVEKDFINFNVTVRTNKDLTAISQGARTESVSGEFNFTPENPLSQLSLIIGDYENRSITVDSIDYQIFNLKGHDYYSSYFTEIGDTLGAVIRELKQDFEGDVGLEYRFPRLSLIEVPIQFFYHPRLWTITQESVQPEMVFMPEKGLLAEGADFSNQVRWQERRRDRSNQTVTPQESQSEIFAGFVRRTLLGASYGRRFGGDIMSISPSYKIFPNYYTFVNHFTSEKWPIFNVALESFLNERTESGGSSFWRMFRGITDEEKANLALMKQNLAEILVDPDKKDIVNSVLKLKGAYLFNLIQSKVDVDEFNNFISDVLKANAFRDTDVDVFVERLLKTLKFDLEPHFDDWYQSRKLPGMLIADVQAYKILDEDRTRYQVRFKLQNTEEVEGLVSASFRMGGGRGHFGPRGGSDQPDEQFISLTPGQIKEIGIVLDDQPRSLTLNTLVSKNLPTTISRRFEELELKEKVKAFEGERLLTEPIKLTIPGEIIVDNEDPGFEVLSQQKVSFLKKLLQSDKEDGEEYMGFNFWRPPNNWRKATFSDFYGKLVHSAHYVKAGKGEKKVAWNTEITKSGNYDVYYHTSEVRMPWMRGRRGGRDGQRRRGRRYLEQFHLIVHHDDGTDEVNLNVEESEDNWNFLGTYYISEGTAKVELTNESKGRVVFADAVKWVKN
jgi:ABC-type transport system involved in multi-copper enzyme maturation permease subunit